jgi:hypothetical protein
MFTQLCDNTETTGGSFRMQKCLQAQCMPAPGGVPGGFDICPVHDGDKSLGAKNHDVDTTKERESHETDACPAIAQASRAILDVFAL